MAEDQRDPSVILTGSNQPPVRVLGCGFLFPVPAGAFVLTFKNSVCQTPSIALAYKRSS
jgi:hypothetical protein